MTVLLSGVMPYPSGHTAWDVQPGDGAVWVANRSDGEQRSRRWLRVGSRPDGRHSHSDRPSDNSSAVFDLAEGIYVAEPVGDQMWFLEFDSSGAWLVDPTGG